MQSPQASVAAPLRGFLGCGGGGIFCEMLFAKELAPSDVGKMNRLLIPKKHATRFFPEVSPTSVDELFLEFQDPESRSWFFRYRYWKSSQGCCVFTKGWNKFVKEKGLRAKDSVTFYRCQEREGRQRTYFIIKAVPSRQEEGPENRNATVGSGLRYKIEVKEEEVISGAMAVSGMTQAQQEKKRVKIFGVWVS